MANILERIIGDSMSKITLTELVRKVIAIPIYIFGIGLFGLGYYTIRIAQHIEGYDEIQIGIESGREDGIAWELNGGSNE